MYKFQFKGGGIRQENANYKFLVFAVDTSGVEHHLFRALKTGLVEHGTPMSGSGGRASYHSVTPVIKLFSATSGFGVAKEYFSYFIMLKRDGTKRIRIKPLSFNKIKDETWSFSGVGRFMTKSEIQKFFGRSSDTFKFYQRQTFLSRHRLSQMVTITNSLTPAEDIERKAQEEVRLLRFD